MRGPKSSNQDYTIPVVADNHPDDKGVSYHDVIELVDSSGQTVGAEETSL